MISIDRAQARALLEEAFSDAEEAVLVGKAPAVPSEIAGLCDTIFQSGTQAYREVLLGCTIARLINACINIRLPYIDLGADAFSGRSLDERVVNPFLQEKRIPCSRGPYLSVFRRSVAFDASTRAGVRDKVGYDALLGALGYAESTSELRDFLVYLLYRFVLLREAANIPLVRLKRISLSQYDALLSGLLSVRSGGLFPLIFTAAAFRTISLYFGVDWQIEWQGINVSDAASGAGGDITVLSRGQVVLAAEVTERRVDKARIISTFNTKIAPSAIRDYLFFYSSGDPAAEAREQAERYFAQGYEVNFVNIKDWILVILATVGASGRELFNTALVELMESKDVPAVLRAAWNDQISALVQGSPV